jgi:hypothetical protein
LEFARDVDNTLALELRVMSGPSWRRDETAACAAAHGRSGWLEL